MARPKLHHKDWKAQEAERIDQQTYYLFKKKLSGLLKTSLFPSILGVIWCDMV